MKTISRRSEISVGVSRKESFCKDDALLVLEITGKHNTGCDGSPRDFSGFKNSTLGVHLKIKVNGTNTQKIFYIKRNEKRFENLKGELSRERKKRNGRLKSRVCCRFFSPFRKCSTGIMQLIESLFVR